MLIIPSPDRLPFHPVLPGGWDAFIWHHQRVKVRRGWAKDGLVWVPIMQMAAAYQASATGNGFSAQAGATSALSISGSERAAIVLFYIADTGVSGIAVTVGGVSCTAVSGATVTGNGITMALYVCVNPPTGSQTANATWTGTSNWLIACIQATGVDQTTPTTTGVSVGSASGTSQDVPVTSTSGDLTVTGNFCSAVDTAQTTNKTKRTTDYACLDTGNGTGTQTHTWSHTLTNMQAVGTNLKAAGAAAPPDQFAKVLIKASPNA